MQHISILLSSLFFIFFLSSCQKEQITTEDPPEEEPIEWKSLENIGQGAFYDLNFINSELLALSKSHFYRIDSNLEITESHFFGHFPHDYSTSIDQDFFTKISDSRIYVFNTHQPDKYSMIDMEEVDPHFGVFKFMKWGISNSIVASHNNRFLTVYRAINEDGVVGMEPHLFLFTANTDASGDVIISDIQISVIEDLYVFGDLLGIYSLQEEFLISMLSKTFRVQQDGNWQKTADFRIYEFIEFQGKLLGFGNDGIYISETQGHSWELLTENLPLGYSPWRQKGFGMGDYLYTSATSSITRLEITDQSITYRSMCLEGLDLEDDNYIFQFVKAHDHIFVSTSTGIYYKTIEDFELSLIGN